MSLRLNKFGPGFQTKQEVPGIERRQNRVVKNDQETDHSAT